MTEPNATTTPVGRRHWWWALPIGLLAIAVPAMTQLPLTSSSGRFESLPTQPIRRGTLLVSVTEQGTLESSNNTEIKCRVRGKNNVINWVIPNGSQVEAGDDLVKLETLLIEEEINERIKFFHLAEASAARSKADVARAELAISEYLEGQFVTQLADLKKNLAVAESQLLSARNMLDHSTMMSESEYVSELEVEEREFAVAQAKLSVKLNKTQIDVLKRFTKAEQLATLRGALNAARATHEADKERAYADQQRLQRARRELELCAVTAERAGLVIYPSGRDWEDAPRIEEGSTVHKDQILLLMPDLTQMQVKVGIHESNIDRVHPGLPATVTLSGQAQAGRTLAAKVTRVSPVTRPAGWWTGNVVKYDTIISLPETPGLKPGMSVEVAVTLAEHDDVLLIPNTAILESSRGYCCWIMRDGRPERRTVELGDSNDQNTVVASGLEENDEVVLDPLAHLKEAQREAADSLTEGPPEQGEQEAAP